MPVSTAPVGATWPQPVVAVMQPYFFPYLGYYQLARVADHFVFLDDVGFIKQGHINRNSILLNGGAHRFSVPVLAASSFRPINAHLYTGAWEPLLALLNQAYRKAPQYRAGMALVEAVVRHPDENVARKNARSITLVFDYLGLPLSHSCAGQSPAADPPLRGQERVLALCAQHHAAMYVNAPGGRALYNAAAFEAQGMVLRFLRTLAHSYPQQAAASAAPWTPHLSMIDLLMHCAPAQIVELLGCCELDP